MRPRQKDFYQWLEKNGHSQNWRHWSPRDWHPEDTNFNRDCEGWQAFLDAYNEEDWKKYIEGLLQDFSRDINLFDFLSACAEAAKKYFEGGWRKACFSAISSEDEQQLIELLSFLKKWHGIEGMVSLFCSDSNELRDLSLLDVPDSMPEVESRYFSRTKGWQYAMPKLLKEEMGEYFWVRFKNPKAILRAKFAFQDGVFVAIPESLLPESCQKLLGLFQVTNERR